MDINRETKGWKGMNSGRPVERMRQVEGMETDAVDESPPRARPAMPTRKEKRNDAAMGKATPSTPRTAAPRRRLLPSAGSAPTLAAARGGPGSAAEGSIKRTCDPSPIGRRAAVAGSRRWGKVQVELGAMDGWNLEHGVGHTFLGLLVGATWDYGRLFGPYMQACQV
jgi:hypothetical protein